MRRPRVATIAKVIASMWVALCLASCTGPGINAGDDGGPAFIALLGMLVVGVFLFWFFLGRGE